MKWTDVEHHEYVVGLDTEMFSFKMKPCKVLGKIAGPVEFYATDVITSTLFSLWWNYFAPESSTANVHHVYVFPHVASQNVFDFTKPLTYLEHGRACRMCADMLQLPVSREFVEHLGSNSVRRGNAAKLGQEVKGGAYSPRGTHGTHMHVHSPAGGPGGRGAACREALVDGVPEHITIVWHSLMLKDVKANASTHSPPV